MSTSSPAVALSIPEPTRHAPSGPAPFPAVPVGCVPLAAGLARFGERPALVLPDRTLTYTELARLVDDVVRRLGPDRRLAVLAADNGLGSLVAYLACLAAGHPLLVVPADKAAALDGLLAAYDPDVVLSGHGSATGIHERRPGSAHMLHPELALLMSTSGSTGSPKLVRLSHANVQANAEAIATYLRIGPRDRAATTLPMSYCYGLSVINSHLLRGASLVLTGLSVVDPCFWEAFRAAEATSFAAVPYTFELLERAGFESLELPSLRYVTQAGGRLAPETVRRYARLGEERGWELFVMYGQTEATARMAYLPPHLAADHPDAIGVPVPGGAFRIEPVDGLEDGELVYAGPNVMLGYAETPADLELGRTVSHLRTGDLARIGVDGLYRVVGRRSRFVKVVGLRVDLARVESLLADLGIDAAAAGADERIVVAVVGEHDDGLLAKDLAVQLGVPRGAVAIHAVPELPRLGNGKIDYPAVRALNDAPPEPRTRPAARGAEDAPTIFADTLDLDPTGIHATDTFVSLGGDSLSYVAASIRLERALGHLPSDWHVTPVESLVPRPSPAAGGRNPGSGTEPTPVPSRRRVPAGSAGSPLLDGFARAAWGSVRLAPLEASIVLRAIAIVAIVGSHIGIFDFQGTAHVLMALCGFNFARFQLAGQGVPRMRRQLRSLARIVVPSVAFIGLAVLVAPDRYQWYNVLLLNAFLGPVEIGDTWNFWFIELLIYMLLGWAALLALPWVGKAERRFPFAFPLAVTAVALLPRFGVLDFPAPHTMPVLWLFALGWAAARARTARRRLLLTAIAAAGAFGFFADDPARNAVIFGGVALMVWVPSVFLPVFVHRLLGILASASVYTYLAHWLIYPPIDEHSQALAFVASLAGGVAYWVLASRALVWVEGGRSRRCSGTPGRGAGVGGGGPTGGAAQHSPPSRREDGTVSSREVQVASTASKSG